MEIRAKTDQRSVNNGPARTPTEQFQPYIRSVKSAREDLWTTISGESLNGTGHSSQTEVVYDDKQQVESGTLDALIERLTTHDNPDPRFNEVFLLTFTSFTTADMLFQKLIERYTTIRTLVTQVQCCPPKWTK